MKKLTLLSLALIFAVSIFGQDKKTKFTKSIGYSITTFYHKNIVYNDTVSYDVEYVDMASLTDSTSIGKMRSRVSFADAVSKPNKYTFDSIPEIASVNINGMYFSNE